MGFATTRGVDLLAVIAFIPTALIIVAGMAMHLSDRGYTFDLRRRAAPVTGGRRLTDPNLQMARR